MIALLIAVIIISGAAEGSESWYGYSARQNLTTPPNYRKARSYVDTVMPEATARAHIEWGVPKQYLPAVPGLDQWNYIVIDSHIAL